MFFGNFIFALLAGIYSRIHYLQRNLDDFNFGQDLNRPKFLRCSNTTLVSVNKPDVIRKGLKMAGIVKAVIKELEPEDPLKILVVGY